MPSRLALSCGLLLLASAAPAHADLFADRVAPLLESRCLTCHNARVKRGGLDLSTRTSALAGGDDGAVLVPGSARKSKLIAAVSGPKPRMPRVGPKLTDAEVGLLTRWIDAGLDWPATRTLAAKGGTMEETWWSLRPLARPPVPAVNAASWPRTPIDRFLLAALEARRLAPAPEADRRTLLRRATFDLTGLPPTPQEVEAFMGDHRPGAYERLVDRLLASPAYGERWGRHWLDVARYADTHGYDKDKRRDHAWPYRDWVIASLNSDRPYGDFIRLQLAGDRLHPGDPQALTATGFVVSGPWDFVGHVELREGTVDKEKTRVVDRDEMVSTAGGAFLSLTVGCARCHDHKFDPIPTRDYYRLQAVFSGVERANRPLRSGPDPDLAARRDRLAAQQAELSRRIAASRGNALAPLDARLADLRKQLAALKLFPADPSPTNGYHGAILPRPDAVQWVQVDLGRTLPLDEVRLVPARPTDFPDAPGFGFPLRYRVELSDDAAFTRPVVLADRTKADVPNPGDEPVVIPARAKRARYVRVTATRLWKRTNDYVFALAELQALSAGANAARGRPVTAKDSIEAGRWSRRHLVDGHDSRHRLPDLADPKTARAHRERAALTASLRAAEADHARLAQALTPLPLRDRQKQLDAERARLDAQLRRSPDGPMVYAVRPIPPRPIWRLHRGDVEQKRERLQPGALSCVPTLGGELRIDRPDDEGARRLALADWIADPRNVLTWRSIANRLWHYHFGQGIVDTPSDFGKMGSRPSHPELLDWLAVELRDGGSLKHLHRLIVTSSAYRQSSRDDEAAARLDSDNRLLWRMNRRRLDAEGLRDAALAVSGQLDRRMGGPGYEPFRFKDDHSPIYDHDDLTRALAPDTYRRTVYRFTVRSVPNAFLEGLDCADPNQPAPVRNTTLTALQALSLMNNPFMVRQSRLLAARLEAASTDVEKQIALLYHLTLSRPPTEDERRLVAAHARKHGLAAACRVMLNANEFMFVD